MFNKGPESGGYQPLLPTEEEEGLAQPDHHHQRGALDGNGGAVQQRHRRVRRLTLAAGMLFVLGAGLGYGVLGSG